MSADSSGKARGDALLALENAAKLAGSLVFTWGIALTVRLMLPRYLGPDAFGVINFADAFTSMVFVLTGLGIDTYIRKEVSVEPRRASEFFAGVTALRVAAAVVLFGVMQAFLVLAHRPRETWLVVHLFGAAAFLLTLNQSFAALLHARGTVNGLSLLNIGSKVLWGTGTLLAVMLRWPLWTIALAVVVSEAVKAVVSVMLVNRHLAMRWKVNAPAAKVAIVGSLPIFLNFTAHAIYNKLDVSLLAVVAGDREVAWYGASSLIAGLALMVTPIIGWVLMPLFARAYARSEAEYTAVMRRSLELVLVIAFPTTLFMALGAEQWVVLLYGKAYAPAATSLRLLSAIFVFTYVAILSANALILTGRAWAQAGISISGLVVNPLLNWLFIPRALKALGEGGAGAGAALAQLGTELTVTVLMTALVGARAFDRRTIWMIVKTLAVCVVVATLDGWLTPRVSAPTRLGADLLAYALLVILTRAVQLRETIDFVRDAFARRKDPIEPGLTQSPLPELSVQGES